MHTHPKHPEATIDQSTSASCSAPSTGQNLQVASFRKQSAALSVTPQPLARQHHRPKPASMSQQARTCANHPDMQRILVIQDMTTPVATEALNTLAVIQGKLGCGWATCQHRIRQQNVTLNHCSTSLSGQLWSLCGRSFCSSLGAVRAWYSSSKT